MKKNTTPIEVPGRPVPMAPTNLVIEVARRSGRSIGTVQSVIYGRLTSKVVADVVAQVRKELGIPVPEKKADDAA
jgi:hypothetical protein